MTAATDPEGRPTPSAAPAQFLEFVPVIPDNVAVGQAHGSLVVHLRRMGRRPHELTVAATAAATGRLLVATDRRSRFDDPPDVEPIEKC